MRRQIFLWMGLVVLFLSLGLSREGFAGEYRVKRGDSLYKISKKFGVSTQELQEANGLRGIALKPTQILTIPGQGKAPTAKSVNSKVSASKTSRKNQSANLSIHVVRKGDSIYSIAKKTGVSVSDIMKANHLRSTRLKIGQHLALSKPVERKEVAAAIKPESVDANALPDGDELEEDDLESPDEDLASIEMDAEASAALLGKWNSPDERRLFVRVAMGFLGAPYRLGGSSVRGLDCSAFVKKIYSFFNVGLPRTAREQSRVGKRIARNDLEAGDLVFFNTRRSSIGHVGIYIGNNEFVHAASGKAKAVKVDTLNKPYYDKHFVKAVRLKSIDDGI
jgi:peptidoglycan endopeptidase LytE